MEHRVWRSTLLFVENKPTHRIVCESARMVDGKLDNGRTVIDLGPESPVAQANANRIVALAECGYALCCHLAGHDKAAGETQREWSLRMMREHASCFRSALNLEEAQ
jgi:hypothetical protein